MCNVATQIKNRQIKTSGQYKIQDANNASGSSITIIEWMNALKLMVNDSQLDKRIQFGKTVIVDKAFQIIHQFQYCLLVLWGV